VAAIISNPAAICHAVCAAIVRGKIGGVNSAFNHPFLSGTPARKIAP
jgi:hypothetical protein